MRLVKFEQGHMRLNRPTKLNKHPSAFKSLALLNIVLGKIHQTIPIFGALVLCALFLNNPVQAVSGINQQINFQGRLLNTQGATVPDGYYNIQFKIYQDGDGQSVGTTGTPAGTPEWTESYLNVNSKGVMVKNGFMSVELGSVTPFGANVDWNQDTLWLSINIANTNTTCAPFNSCSPDGEMLPMKRLSSTPYALNSGLLGGISSAGFLQIAQGVQTDATTNTNSIYINKTGTGNLMTLQSSGNDVFNLSNAGDISFGSNTSHSITVASSAVGIAGKSLSISGGTTTNSGAGADGGNLTLQGGNAAGVGNNNGGSVTISGGFGTGTGIKGLINLGASAYTSTPNATCAANCTITQSNVDEFGTVIINASTSDIVITLPPPTNTTTSGRILYITSANDSKDFMLTTNTSTDLINVAMRQNTTATMIWNGSAWTAGGASNATTLQAAYDNGSNPDTTPEIKLDPTRGTIDIQDANTSIGSDILNVRGSNAGGLGTVLFGVSNAGRVTIQGTTDQYSAFRVLRSNGDYLFNINSSNNYVFSNSISSPGNDISNPTFETGGSISGGEEGWFGPAQASIVSDASNAHGGNYEMQVMPNSTNLDVYAGNYYEVKPDDSVYFEGYVKNSAGANGNAGIQITWYNKDKGVVSYSTNYGGLPGTSYVLRRVNATVPAGVYYARVSATVRSTSNTGIFYFDDLYLKNSTESADYTFRNSQNSTTAFRIQSAQSAQTLLTASTTNNILKVGDSTGTDTDTTLLVLDNSTADPTTNLSVNNGALFYRSDNNSIKAIVGGAVVDVCTTAVTCTGYSAAAGSTVQLQGASPGTAQTGNFNISGTGIMTQLQTQDMSSVSTHSSNLVIRTGNATGSGSNSGNLTLDVGTATGNTGTITIGHSGVATTMVGTLKIQGSNTLTLGTASSAIGSILFNTSAGSNNITLKAPGANPTSSYSLTLPQVLGIAGDCLKDTGSGVLGFSNCAAGITVTLQNAYDNSSPANTTLADGKNYNITAQQTTTSPSIVFNLQCTTNCVTNGRFAIQNGGADVFTVQSNNTGIVMGTYTQIGSSVTNSTQTNFQLDSSNQTVDVGACSTTVNQGAMYYNTSMGSIRSCINGTWSDVSNPDTLGLLTFGIVPSSGTSNNYDLPSLIIPGVSGPCKVSFYDNNTVHIEACVAYSGGRRVNVAATNLTTNSATTNNIALTTTNRWGHVCLTGSNNQPAFTTTAGQTTATAGMPTFNSINPILCLADVQGSATTAGLIDNLYDVRTFTSTLKEAVNVSTAVELGMITDAGGTNGALVPAVSASSKLYGLVVATDGATSAGAPNTIVATVGSGWVKANAGTAGQFIKTSLTSGYGNTTAAIPNNSFYYSVGNTRTSYSTTCTTAANCNGSLYVNFIVR